MFNKHTKLVEEIAKLKESIINNDNSYKLEISRINEANEYKINRLKIEHDDNIKSIRFNEKKVIEEAIIKLKEENNALTIQTQTQGKEVEMYTKAFENLGFDVKDMKDILNKLVDGLIAKNEIKLVN